MCPVVHKFMGKGSIGSDYGDLFIYREKSTFTEYWLVANSINFRLYFPDNLIIYWVSLPVS